MYDFFLNLSNTYPAWLLFFAMTTCIFVGGFISFMLGSVRWWWIKRTRMPELWKSERAGYLAEIDRLKSEALVKDEAINRLKTAAFGQVVMEFRGAVQAKETEG